MLRGLTVILMVTDILLCVLFTLARYVVVEDFKGLFGEKYIIGRAKRTQHIRVLLRFWYIGECGSTLYVGLSGIVRNLIQNLRDVATSF